MNSSFKSDVETFAQKISQNDAAFLHAIYPYDKEHPKRCGVPLSPGDYADVDSALSGRARGTSSCNTHKWGTIGPKSMFRGRTKPSPFNFANKVDKYSPPWGCALTAAHFQECNEPNTGKENLLSALQSIVDKKNQSEAKKEDKKRQMIG